RVTVCKKKNTHKKNIKKKKKKKILAKIYEERLFAKCYKKNTFFSKCLHFFIYIAKKLKSQW
ncbi:unnamed protein product, partial [Staurois parvus]